MKSCDITQSNVLSAHSTRDMSIFLNKLSFLDSFNPREIEDSCNERGNESDDGHSLVGRISPIVPHDW